MADAKNKENNKISINKSSKVSENYKSLLFNKKFIIICSWSVCISIIFGFFTLKIWLKHSDEKINIINNDIAQINNQNIAIDNTISKIDEEIKTIKLDVKTNKDNFNYLKTSIAAIKKELDIIKIELNSKNKEHDESINPSPDHKNFLEALEKCVSDGTPFADLIASYKHKININNYNYGAELIRFCNETIKTLNTLKEDFLNIGSYTFKTKFKESFWKKQKRLIKEKILNAIRFNKPNKSFDDKTLFEMANNALTDGNIELALEYLKKINIKNNKIDLLINDLKKRHELNIAFAEFKKEFISLFKRNR
ncbi:MAG: hypothetical protein LBF70_01300 [Holosporales bacterium]|jgi:hypothetical protein|nr:hypothetical protein [Holosporales bacterium]